MTTTATGDELEDLPEAFELDPDRPRLVGCGIETGAGRLSFGLYNDCWLIRRDGNSVIVEPNLYNYRGSAWFFTILSIVVPAAIECAILLFMSPGDQRLILAIVMPVMAFMFLVGSAFAHGFAASEAARGTILGYSADEEQIQLPRIKCVIPRSQMVRFDLISGSWTRAVYSSFEPEETFSDSSTELHLVVRLKGGMLVSLPLLGTQSTFLSRKRGLGYAAQLLSEVSGLPLERVKEKSGFRNPYRKIRERRKQDQITDADAMKEPRTK